MGNRVIYRPAYEAEVEYLESTGTQWIDTNVIPASSWKIEIEYMVTQMECFLFGARTSYLSSDAFSSYMDSLGIYIQYDGNQERINGVGNSLNQRYKLIMSADGAFLDDVKIRDANSNIFTCPCNLYLFAKNQPNEDGWYRPFKGYIYYCKVWDSNNTLVRDFIPVRIGSVGYLYDKVTKQLFANKGTGNFILGNDVSNAVIPQQRCVLYFGNQRSVIYERIYEEYEWLVGHLNDGVSPSGQSNGANFILDRSIDLTNKVMKIKFDTPCRDFAIVGGMVDGHQYILRTFIMENGTQVVRETIGSTIINSDSQSTKNDEVVFDFINNIASAGSISIPIQGTGYSYSNAYGVYWSATKIIGNITIDNELNLVPCKLLQSIPAILDGNGIARAAGICGMWDKKNNKFYGNVASSGTFTVSND